MASAAAWLAATKLTAPARRHDALLRQRLIDTLRRSLSQTRLTLISAPAGAGKTALLAELPHAFPQTRGAWLLLDEEDNDPSRFAAALAASLESAGLILEKGVLASSEWRQIVTGIINKASQYPTEQIALVLDDLHVISVKGVHEILDYLADRLPPNMRVILATRHDPPMSLARRSARGELAEIRLADLSFTEQESGQLANQCLGLELSQSEVHPLHTRTEGWAAGLRLLAISLTQAPANKSALLQSGMQGSRRIFDFLAEEVLDRQTPDLRCFLLETSILTSLRPEVCDALTGRRDSLRVLEDLYRRNLYVVAACEAETSFRYHDLFADFLRERLKRERPEDWNALQVRAARAESSPHDRLRHLLAGEDWDGAVAEIEKIGPEYAGRGFVLTLQRWIGELPQEVRSRSPRTLYLLGHAIWTQSEFAQAEPYIEQALEGFRRLNDRAGQGEALVALANSAMMQSQFERTNALLEEALGFEISAAGRTQLHTASAWSAVYRQDWPEAERHLAEVYKLVESGEGTSNPLAVQIVLFSEGLPGYLDKIDAMCKVLREKLTGTPDLSHASYYMLRGAVLLHRGDMEEADRQADKALAIARDCGQIVLVIAALCTSYSMTAAARGDWASMDRWSTQGLDENKYGQITRNWRLHFQFLQARARWHAGDLEGLRKTYEDAVTPNPVQAPASRPYLFLIRGMLRMADRSYAQAEQAFREAVREEDAFKVTRAISSGKILLAYALFTRGRAAEAMEVFAPYLEESEHWNLAGQLTRENPIVQPLLRYAHERNIQRPFVERVLELMGASLNPLEASGGEGLSERELEVLRVMSEGLGNREIGERLFVSEATVKTHVQRILRKLDASSRTQAVSRARELMIL